MMLKPDVSQTLENPLYRKKKGKENVRSALKNSNALLSIRHIFPLYINKFDYHDFPAACKSTVNLILEHISKTQREPSQIILENYQKWWLLQ